jgi:hypothetical protein
MLAALLVASAALLAAVLGCILISPASPAEGLEKQDGC